MDLGCAPDELFDFGIKKQLFVVCLHLMPESTSLDNTKEMFSYNKNSTDSNNCSTIGRSTIDRSERSWKPDRRGRRIRMKCPACHHVSRIRKCCLCGEPLFSSGVMVCSDCIERGQANQQLHHCLACGTNLDSLMSIPSSDRYIATDSQMQGWLDLYNEEDRKCHRRYYVIRDNFLYGFKSARARRTVSLNFLEELRFVPVDHGHRRRFGIEVSSRSVSPYQVFYAESEEARSLWLGAFRKAARQLVFEDFYTLGEQIGAGHFAKVFKCTQKSTDTLYAVKVMNLQECKDVVKVEAALMPLVHHPNIAFFQDIFKSESKIYLVMIFEAGGDLCTRISDKGPFLESTARVFVKKLINAVKYLHNLGIAHRDLKPENIMLSSMDSDTDFKIIDFGLCIFLTPGDVSRKPCGTFAYMAPEIATQYDYRVDIWNIGIIMYFILTGHRPFTGYDLKKLLQQKKLGLVLQKIGKRQLQIDDNDEFWAKISPEAKDLLRGLMHHEVEERISLTQALDHPWFKMES